MKKRRKRAERKHSEGTGDSVAIGIAWYRREQWPRLLEVSADRDQLEATYDEWVQAAERHVSGLLVWGLSPSKVDIDIEEVVAWCAAQGRPVDGEARSEFAAVKIQKLAEQDPT